MAVERMGVHIRRRGAKGFFGNAAPEFFKRALRVPKLCDNLRFAQTQQPQRHEVVVEKDIFRCGKLAGAHQKEAQNRQRTARRQVAARERHGLKTAALIACPAKMGALIADAPQAMADALYDFGWQIGLAFQICDDYLDTFGKAQVFGKKIGGDILCGKKTWLLVEAFRRATGEDRSRLDSIMAMDSATQAAEKIAAMQQLYIKLGVKEAAVAAIEDYHARALEMLSGKGFSDGQIQQLRQFSAKLVHRED